MHHVPIRATAEGEPEFALPAYQISKGVVLAIMERPANIRRLNLRPLGCLPGQYQSE